MTKTLIKIETWLPIFSGFYECGYLPSDNELDGEVEHYATEHGMDRDWLEANLWDCIDYQKEAFAVAQALVSAIEDKLKEIIPSIESVKMQKIVSPREYNFTNDAINIEMEVSEGFFAEMIKLVNKHGAAFDDYITSTYTSRSGFASYYSNDHLEWIAELMKMTPEEYHTHKIGSMMQFLCLELIEEEDRQEYSLLQDAFCNGLSIGEFINEEKLMADYAERDSD